MDFLSPFMTAWAGSRSQPATRSSPRPGRRRLLAARQSQLLRRTAGWIRAAVKADKRLYISRQVKGMSEEATLKDAAGLYRSLRFFARMAAKLSSLSRSCCSCVTTKGNLWLTLLPPSPSSQDTLAKWRLLSFAMRLSWPYKTRRLGIVLLLRHKAWTWNACPPFWTWKRTSGRCLGPRRRWPSGIPNELWRADAPRMARTWYAPTLKTHVRLTEPVRLSTGLLVALFKNRGSPHEVGNYRSIFLLEGVGKAARKCARQSFVDFLHNHAPPLFQGCLPRSSLAQLTQYAYTLLRIARGSGARLFPTIC